MIEYQREEQIEMIQAQGFLVKVIGVGGAGSNVLDQIALDGMEDAELICMNTDVRTLKTSTAHAKVQIGKQLTRGLGAGGDPELGILASEEAEEEIRSSVRGQDMVFICTGLGGGTGSGAAPTVSRIAKEEDAFVVVFATMPFSFEGRRRIQQAETALKLLERSADALITFENDRMGELVLPKEGIQQAFSNADKIISQSVRAITNVVTQPGLIQIGMDDLLTALKTPTSRCLFGYGEAKGKNRAQEALKIALRSPLLDRGKLLGKSRNALVHVVGGPSMTLYEVELLMNQMSKNVGSETQILFGSATDEKMEDRLSVTIISSLTLDDLRRHHSAMAQTETTETPAGYVTSTDEDTDLAEEPEHEQEEEAVASRDNGDVTADEEESAAAEAEMAEAEAREREETARRERVAQAQAREEAQNEARREREQQAAREAEEAQQAEVAARQEAAEAEAREKAEAEAASRRETETEAQAATTESPEDDDTTARQEPEAQPTISKAQKEFEAKADDGNGAHARSQMSAEEEAEQARREAFERRRAELKRTSGRAQTPEAPARPTAEELMSQRRQAQEELKRKREELERLLKLEDEAKRKRPAQNAVSKPESTAQVTEPSGTVDDHAGSPIAQKPIAQRPIAQKQPAEAGTTRRLEVAPRPPLPHNQNAAHADAAAEAYAPKPGAADDGLSANRETSRGRPSTQAELQLEPLRGRFEKAAPTMVDGENLDVPTFFRKRGKKP